MGLHMEIKDFDRKYHKKVFFNRLGIGLYSLLFPVIAIGLFILISNVKNIVVATNTLLALTLIYNVGFLLYSIILIIVDKKVIYDINKIHKGYKIGFVICKVLSYLQLIYCNAILIVILFIGALGSSLHNGSRYDIGDENNRKPEYVYTIDEYNDNFCDESNKLNKEIIEDFSYSYTKTNRFLASCTHYTTYIKYNDETIYQSEKNDLISSNKFINKSIMDENGFYVYPITTFTIENYNFYVVESDGLYELKVIGYSDLDKAVVILETLDHSTYDHFGNDINIAEEAFIDYIKNIFYLPWCETIEE